MMSDASKPSTPGRHPVIYALAFLLAVGGTIAILLLLQNVATHKIEARVTHFKMVEVDETTIDPAEWGKNFPRQYDSYKRTVDIDRTRYGGSEAYQKIDSAEGGDDRWQRLFAGYAFGFDYREERGHAYMLSDQRETERVKRVQQPGACLQCHASTTVAYRKIGIEQGIGGDLLASLDSPEGRTQLMKGFETVCEMPYEEATALVEHPVTCLDCHDPDSMALRVTRPGFINGIAAFAKSEDPAVHLPSIERWRQGDRAKDYDANELASRQEMRSLACAQCHVEYYFKPGSKLLTYPWHNGLKMEQTEAYYETAGVDGAAFKDWTHKETGAPMLKAQHPEFELWSQGIHARSGVSCADCHMPYVREGATKVSDHQTRSPLLNINRSCQTCHNVPETELLARAETIQDRTAALMDKTQDAVIELIDLIVAAQEAGMTDEQLVIARDYHRKAEWRLDYIAAENSMGFHADQEAARILGEAIDMARKGQVAVLESMISKDKTALDAVAP